MAILIYYICMYNVISDNAMSRTNETKNCKNKIGRKKTKNYWLLNIVTKFMLYKKISLFDQWHNSERYATQKVSEQLVQRLLKLNEIEYNSLSNLILILKQRQKINFEHQQSALFTLRSEYIIHGKLRFVR